MPVLAPVDFVFSPSNRLFVPYGHLPDHERPLPPAVLRLQEHLAETRHNRPPWTDRDGLPRISGGATAVAYRLVSGTPFAAATGAKTFMLAIAPAGHGLSLTEAAISMDGVTATAVPALVEIVSSTQAGAGTSGVTPTITQVRGRATAGSAPTGGGNYTVEPTVLVSLARFYIPQFMGGMVYQLPLGREIECDSSAGTIKALGIRINTSATVNVVGHLEIESA